MNMHVKAAAIGGVMGAFVVALAFLALGNGPRSVWSSTPAKSVVLNSSEGLTHEDMHRMMDAGQGEGTTHRMHEAMGPDAEEMMMDQCTSMMAMMEEMQDMIGGSGTGMMGSQNTVSMRDMMAQ